MSLRVKRTREDELAEQVKGYYEILIDALRYVAYRHGFALAVHGSLRRDIDLIAAPWRESAVGGDALAKAISGAIEAIIGTSRERKEFPNPEKKPCGRLGYSFYLTHDDFGPYVDLSIMPVTKSESDGPA